MNFTKCKKQNASWILICLCKLVSLCSVMPNCKCSSFITIALTSLFRAKITATRQWTLIQHTWALAHHDCTTLFDRKNCKNLIKSTSSGLSTKLAIRTKMILFKRVQTVMRGCLFVKSAQNQKSIIREHLVLLKLSGRDKALSLSAVKHITVLAKKIN